MKNINLNSSELNFNRRSFISLIKIPDNILKAFLFSFLISFPYAILVNYYLISNEKLSYFLIVINSIINFFPFFVTSDLLVEIFRRYLVILTLKKLDNQTEDSMMLIKNQVNVVEHSLKGTILVFLSQYLFLFIMIFIFKEIASLLNIEVNGLLYK